MILHSLSADLDKLFLEFLHFYPSFNIAAFDVKTDKIMRSGYSLAHLAAGSNSLSISQLLVEKGISINRAENVNYGKSNHSRNALWIDGAGSTPL